MYLLERYIFRRTFLSFVLTLLSLSATVWLSQALREFDLVTARGQTLVTFFYVSVLLLPTLVMIISPVALMIAVLYVLNTMNSESELAIINAAGAPQGVTVRPVLWISLIAMLGVAATSVYFAPITQRASRDLVTRINSDILTSVIREGTFMDLANGLTIHIKERGVDGSLNGIFVADEREPDQSVSYLARRGALLDNPLGLFLVMQDGVIQRQNKSDGSISIVEFQSYAFDFSALTRTNGVVSYKASERTTEELMRPDPNDTQFQRFPGRFRAELHDRLSMPLYALVLGLMPLAFLGQARTTKQGRGAGIAAAVLTGLAVRGIGFMLIGAVGREASWVPFVYAVPLAAIGASLLVAFGIVRPRLPRWLIGWANAMFRPISGRVRRSSPRRA